MIGDTGWTSFNKGSGTIQLDTFNNQIPETQEILNFSYSSILELHTKWIDYANSIISSNEKVIILTHFPMICSAKTNADLWWSSKTKLMKQHNYWSFSGHTHQDNQYHNYVSRQRGYTSYNPATDYIDCGDFMFFLMKIGVLERLSDSRAILSSKELLSKYFNSELLSIEDKSEIMKVRKRGFIRSSANKHVFSALSSGHSGYIKKVKKVLSGRCNNPYIGFYIYNGVSEDTINEIKTALDVLIQNDMTDIRLYMTAVVVTGRAYNNESSRIPYMRPLDDYDVIRFYLVLLTMKKYNISSNKVERIRKHPKNYLTIGKVDIYIPQVNDYSISPDELMLELRKTKLIPGYNNSE